MLAKFQHRRDPSVAEFGRGLRLSCKTGNGVAVICQRRIENLDANQTIQFRILCFENKPHAATGDKFNDSIVSDSSNFIARFCRTEDPIKIILANRRVGNQRLNLFHKTLGIWILDVVFGGVFSEVPQSLNQ